MKKLFYAVIAMMAFFAACQKNEIAAPSNDGQVLYATIEDLSATRTVLDEDNNIRWSEGDQIIGFINSTLGLKYQVTASSVGQTSASFDEVGSGGLNAGTELDHIIAYYPYSSAVKVAKSGADYALEVALPSEQTYAHESFGNGSFPMVAVSQTNNITFRNVCGGMKLQLKGTAKIATIKVEGKNNEKLSGKASVTAYTDASKPSIVMADDASTSAVLNCGSGVQLNQDDATDFIISLPPTVFTKGFTITVTDVNGGAQVIETSKSNTVLRSGLLKMPEAVVETCLSLKDLSEDGTANSYIVSEAGTYKFTPTKGNSSEPVGTIASAETLWETFGTDVTPNVGDLVKNVKYENGVISFETPSTFKEGNAVIAAKDANGTILWSWHIWLTDQPEGQVYYNEAGTMMDRNLGATSATPGDVGALGLLYQWGRKDPFLGSSDISDNVEAKSTITWPSAVSSDSSNGTIAYATANPTTFIKDNSKNYDWYYTGSSSTDNTRWTISANNKSIYDPCPVGWRVPDGGEDGVWSKALGSSSDFNDESLCNDTNKGMNFSGKFGSASTIWYPVSGYRVTDGELNYGGDCGGYWSASPAYIPDAYCLFCINSGYVYPAVYSNRVIGYPIRCVQESVENAEPIMYIGYLDNELNQQFGLSKDGIENVYSNVTQEVITAGINRGIIKQMNFESKGKTEYPSTPKYTISIFLIPYSSSMNVYIDNGIGGIVPFDHPQLHINGERIITLGNTDYKVYGEYESLNVFMENVNVSTEKFYYIQ